MTSRQQGPRPRRRGQRRPGGSPRAPRGRAAGPLHPEQRVALSWRAVRPGCSACDRQVTSDSMVRTRSPASSAAWKRGRPARSDRPARAGGSPARAGRDPSRRKADLAVVVGVGEGVVCRARRAGPGAMPAGRRFSLPGAGQPRRPAHRHAATRRAGPEVPDRTRIPGGQISRSRQSRRASRLPVARRRSRRRASSASPRGGREQAGGMPGRFPCPASSRRIDIHGARAGRTAH